LLEEYGEGLGDDEIPARERHRLQYSGRMPDSGAKENKT
jgi:hypothetical protein